jgi:hypothetical protein
MKTKLCDRFLEEVAAHASDSAPLSRELSAHAESCPGCREKIAELKAIAAMQREAAANLPEPNLRLSRRRLERALQAEAGQHGQLAMWLRPAFIGLAAIILLATLLVIRRPPQIHVERQPQGQEQQAPRVEEQPLEPTMLALRHEVQDGREQILAAVPTGRAIRHYRVRDVEMELGN